MLDTEVYAKTDAGRDEIRSRGRGLSMADRAILLMIDGQRPVSAMRPLIAGSKAPPEILDILVAKGLIEPRGGVPVAAPAVAPAPVVASPPPGETLTALVDEPEQTAPPADFEPTAPAVPFIVTEPVPIASYDGPLDLVLPTIIQEEPASLVPSPVTEIDAMAVIGADAFDVPTLDRYEHLYGMMNDIVRDFLAPHRRFFFQLKIERCRTAEELIELLHDLQTALAKARGEAFASDVIARLRSAAA